MKIFTQKLTIICAILMAGLSSCDGNQKTESLQNLDGSSVFKNAQKKLGRFNGDVEIITIDSCEYIVWRGSHGEVGYCHKGNCKWCNLRQNAK